MARSPLVYGMTSGPRGQRTMLDGNAFLTRSLEVRTVVYDIVRLHGLAFRAEDILAYIPMGKPRFKTVRPTLDEVKAAMVLCVEKRELVWVDTDGEPRVQRP